jgi:hypothetical protein
MLRPMKAAVNPQVQHAARRRPDARPRPEHRATGASLVVVVCVAVCFVGIMLLHAVRSDVDPLRQVMSNYANGSRGPVMSVVFYAFGVAALLLGVRLRTAIDRSGITRAFPGLMVVAGVALIAAGVFEVDRPLAPQTIQEKIHSNSAVFAFVLLIVAMLLFSMACRGDDRWWPLRWYSMALAVLAASAAVGTQVSDGTSWSGAVQRVLAGAVLAWVLLTVVHIRGKVFRAS